MGMVRAVVFDLDGTLIHSAPSLHHAVAAMLADLGRPTVTLAQVTGFIGNGVARLVERSLAATGGADNTGRARALFDAHYAAAPPTLTTLYPGARAALEALRAGGVTLGLCTNKPQIPAEKALAELDLTALFDVVVGGDAVALKPDPASLRLCLSRLGADTDTAVYVGDSETDAATARAAAAPFALYTQGYRSAPVETLGAAFAFDDFAALPPWALAR